MKTYKESEIADSALLVEASKLSLEGDIYALDGADSKTGESFQVSYSDLKEARISINEAVERSSKL